MSEHQDDSGEFLDEHKSISLCETLDRVLNKGVFIAGEIIISVADIDLIYLGLQLVLTSVETAQEGAPDPAGWRANGEGSHMTTRVFAAQEELADFARSMTAEQKPTSPRINLNPDDLRNGLAKLVLTLIELLRELLERQAIRRIEGGSLRDDEVERIGSTFLQLSEQMVRLKKEFGLEQEDLNLDLGPLGKLL